MELKINEKDFSIENVAKIMKLLIITMTSFAQKHQIVIQKLRKLLDDETIKM